MTIIDCCISLKMIKKNLVVLGVVDMRQLLLKPDNFGFYLLLCFIIVLLKKRQKIIGTVSKFVSAIFNCFSLLKHIRPFFLSAPISGVKTALHC